MLDSDPDLPMVYTDQASLERILAELLNNACKYTPPGERIALKTQVEPGDNPEQVVFILTNTGVTIPVDEQERIFDKFYRVPSADPWKTGGYRPGSGPGKKKLVMYLEGSISLVSEQDETVFTITIPIQPLLKPLG